MPFGIQTQLNIRIFDTGREAADAGFEYGLHNPIPKPVEIDTAVVVRNGTVNGNATVDLLLHDADGNRYVVMITGNLLKSLPL